jgi:3'-5' exonuclease
MSWASAIRKVIAPSVTTVPRRFVKCAQLDPSRIVTIDFETYFDVDYTLKKMSTSEYIRDPRFKAQMMGIKIGSGKTRVVSTKQIKATLKRINWATHTLLCHNTQFDGFILSHHYGVIPLKYYDTLCMARGLHSNEIGAGLDDVAQYYGRGSKIEGVLEKTKGVRDWPAALYNEAAMYCEQDVDLTYAIFQDMAGEYPASEMELIHITTRMFCAPVLRVDLPRVQTEYEREVKRREELLLTTVDPQEYADAGLLKGKEKQLTGIERDMLIVKRVIGSNERFAEMLREAGAEPPVKISPAWIKKPPSERDEEGKWAYAFAKDDLEFIGLPDKVWEMNTYLDPNKAKDVATAAVIQERLQQLVDTRIAVKSTTNITRAERFLTAGMNGMKLPVGYAYYRAHTGRWGGNNKMNMQNLTRGGELRLSILAAPGHQVAVADSGQIEARVNGWLWNQHDLLDAFRVADKWDKSKGVARGNDRDAYCRFADEVYGYEITKNDDLERFVGKVCVLGLGYQMGAPKFQMTLAKGALGGPPVHFPLEKCQFIVQTYRRKNYKIAQGWEKCKEIIEDMAAGIEGSWKCLHWEKNRIWLPNGMSLKYPELRKAKGEKGWDEWSYQSGDIRKKIYGGLLCENLVQALARIIVGEQMLMIDKKYLSVMTTHDEIVTHPKKNQAAKCFDYMLKCMSTPLDWCMDIPLSCEGGWADNYSK